MKLSYIENADNDGRICILTNDAGFDMTTSNGHVTSAFGKTDALAKAELQKLIYFDIEKVLRNDTQMLNFVTNHS